MRATLTDLLDMIDRLAELSDQEAASALEAFEIENGASESVKAIFELAAIYRKAKAAA